MKSKNIIYLLLLASSLVACNPTTSSSTGTSIDGNSTTSADSTPATTQGGSNSVSISSADTTPIVRPNTNFTAMKPYSGTHWDGLNLASITEQNDREDALYKYMRGAQGSYKSAFVNVSYSTGTSAVREADRDPNDDNSVLSLYDYHSIKSNNGPVASGQVGWNREHTFPQSKLNQQANSGPNSATDIANLFAADSDLNEQRSNFPYVDRTLVEKYEPYTIYNSFGTRTDNFVFRGGFSPTPQARGEIARAQMYMMVMWPNNAGKTSNGTLETFIKWDREYPPVAERDEQRNRALEKYQKVRNPFIDMRELGCTLWSDLTVATQAVCKIA